MDLKVYAEIGNGSDHVPYPFCIFIPVQRLSVLATIFPKRDIEEYREVYCFSGPNTQRAWAFPRYTHSFSYCLLAEGSCHKAIKVTTERASLGPPIYPYLHVMTSSPNNTASLHCIIPDEIVNVND